MNGNHPSGYGADFGRGPDDETINVGEDPLTRSQRLAEEQRRVRETFEAGIRAAAGAVGDPLQEHGHVPIICKECNRVAGPRDLVVQVPTGFWVCGNCYLTVDWSDARRAAARRASSADQGAQWGPQSASQFGAEQQEREFDRDGFQKLYEEFMRNMRGPAGSSGAYEYRSYRVAGERPRPTPAIDPGAWVVRAVDCVPPAERRRVVNALLKTYHPDVNASPDAEAVTRALVAALARCK